LGNFSGSRVVGFILCPLIADGTVSDLIVPRKRLENSLRVHDDVNVSGRSAIRDTDRLISLVPKSGSADNAPEKKRYEGESRDAELEDSVSRSRLMRLACLCFRLLCFRWFGFFRSGRFLFFAARRFRFLARWRLRFFRRRSPGFFLLLSRFCFGLLLGGRFRC